MRVQGALDPCCPFLGAVCTLQLNQSEAEKPCGGVFTDFSSGATDTRCLSGSVLPGPQELCKQGPQEGGQPPVPEHSDLRGQLQCQGPAGASCLAVAVEATRAQPSQATAGGPDGAGAGGPEPPDLQVRARRQPGRQGGSHGRPMSWAVAGARGWLLLSSRAMSSAHTRAGFSDF